MKIIRTKIHGIIDYPLGIGIVAMPWFFGFHSFGIETGIPVLLGCLFVVSSLITNYEWGVAKYMPMVSHLFLDGSIGIVLALSPWIFDFEDVIYLPHVVVGCGVLFFALISSSKPYLYLYYAGSNSSYTMRSL